MPLFEQCPVCPSMWTSQPHVNLFPAANPYLAAVVLVTGSSLGRAKWEINNFTKFNEISR